MTAAEMRDWVKPIIAKIPRGDLRQNKFRDFAQLNLMNALGRKSEFRSKTVAQVLDAAVASVGDPRFVPKYDPSLRSLDWPEGAAAASHR